MTFLSFVFATLGCLLIAASQKKPLKILSGVSAIDQSQKRTRRITGSLLVFGSFLIAVASEGWSFGSAAWLSIISIAALAVSLVLAFYGKIGKQSIS